LDLAFIAIVVMMRYYK